VNTVLRGRGNNCTSRWDVEVAASGKAGSWCCYTFYVLSTAGGFRRGFFSSSSDLV